MIASKNGMKCDGIGTAKIWRWHEWSVDNLVPWKFDTVPRQNVDGGGVYIWDQKLLGQAS